MATIDKYTSQVGLEPGGTPRVSLDNSLGRAIEGLGGTIGAVARQVQQRQDQRDEFRAANGKRRFDLQLEEERQKMLENAPPDGAGFHDGFMRDVYNPKREE